jgi:hypothetical protein
MALNTGLLQRATHKRCMNRIVFGDSLDMAELDVKSVHLVLTSPPYFNAGFDYPDFFDDYDQFLETVGFWRGLFNLRSVRSYRRSCALLVCLGSAVSRHLVRALGGLPP